MTDASPQSGDSGSATPPASAPACESLPADNCFDCADWMAFGLTSFIAFAGYWFTLAPNVTLEFSGLMSTGAMYGGQPQLPAFASCWGWPSIFTFPWQP